MPVLETIVERQDKTREGTIIFVHGLGGDPFATWGRKDASDKDYLLAWLKEDLQSYSIYSVSYAAELSARQGNTVSLADLGLGLFESLQAHKKVINGPIAFVGHSLGGLLIKHMLRCASQHHGDAEDHPIVQNARQVVFLATPHRGSSVATAALKRAVETLVQPSRLVRALEENDDSLAELNDWYRDFCVTRPQLLNKVYFETRKTKLGFRGWASALIVDRQSANPELPNVRAIAIDSDHVGICKPASRQSALYPALKTFLGELSTEARPPKGKRLHPAEPPGDLATANDRRRKAMIAASAVGAMTLFGVLVKPYWPAQLNASSNTPVEQSKQTGVTPVPRPANDRAEADKAEQYKQAREQKEAQDRLAAELKTEKDKADRLARELSEQRDAKRAQDDALREITTGTDRVRLKVIAERHAELAAHVERRVATLDRADAEANAKLAQSVQDELKRLGCFSGPGSPNWGERSKEAAKQFNKHAAAAAAIPVEKPTAETHARLATYKARVCPVTCVPPKIERQGACELPPAAASVGNASTSCPPDQWRRADGKCGPGFVASIGAEPDAAAAMARFADIQQRYTGAIGARPPNIKANGDRTLYSVRIGPAGSREAIVDFCRQLMAAGFDRRCYPAEM